MRDIDKGLLLAEYFDVDTKNNVSAFIQWIKSQPCYEEFLEKKNELKNTSFRQGKRIYEYAKTIHPEKAKTMEEAWIEYGKINYLLKISDVNYYSNPLLLQYEGIKQITLGDLKIEFDGKMMTFNEFSSLEGYSFESKDRKLKEVIDNWMKEADFYIVDPIRQTKTNTFFFPKYKVFSFRRTTQFVFLICMLLFLFFIGITTIDSLHMIADNGYGKPVSFMYHMLISFSAIYLVEIIILLIIKGKQYNYYNKQYGKVYADIDGESLKLKEEVYAYFSKAISGHLPLDKPVDSFNRLTSLMEPASFFEKRYEQRKILKNDYITIAEKISIVIYSCLLIAFLICLFIGKRGGF